MTEGSGAGEERERFEGMVELDLAQPVWDRFFTVNPLVVVGTREGDGFDLAPKHMAFPLGWDNYFGFACTPRHSTYHNARQHKAFAVSYPSPAEIVTASLAAQPREGREGTKSALEVLDTEPAREVEGVLLRAANVQLECVLDRVVDDLGANSLLVGRIVAARVRREVLRTSARSDWEVIHDAPLLAFLAPGRFARVVDSEAFPFPADFRR